MSSGRERAAAVVGLCKVAAIRARDGDAAEGERRIAGVGQGGGLRRATGTNVLVRESQACRRQARGGRCPCAGQADGLRAAAGVIADRQRRASAAASPRRKRHVDGALRVAAEGGGTVVGLGKVAAVGPGDANTADGHGRTAGVGNRHGLSGAGGVDLLVAE